MIDLSKTPIEMGMYIGKEEVTYVLDILEESGYVHVEMADSPYVEFELKENNVSCLISKLLEIEHERGREKGRWEMKDCEKKELEVLLKIKDKLLGASKMKTRPEHEFAEARYVMTIDQKDWHEIFKTERARAHGLIK